MRLAIGTLVGTNIVAASCAQQELTCRYYQRVGAELLLDLLQHTEAPCGFATLHDVQDKSQEDRMESFFLSETLVC